MKANTQQTKKELYGLYHLVAALVAHQTSQWSPQMLSSPTLFEAAEGLSSPLNDLALKALRPPDLPTASRQTRWVTTYLRTVLILAAPVPSWGLDDPDGQLVALVDHGRLPKPAMLLRLIHLHPILSSRNVNLMEYAYPDNSLPVAPATPAPPTHRAPQLFATTGPTLVTRGYWSVVSAAEPQITVAELIQRNSSENPRTWPDAVRKERRQPATIHAEPGNGTM
jgi:hypothetical protein